MASLIITIFAASLYPVLCLWRRPVALAVLCAVLPAYLLRFSIPLPGIGSLPSTLLEVLFIEFFAIWLFTDGTKKGAWRALDAWAEPIALLLIGAAIGVALSPDLRAGLGLWRAYFLEPVLFFVAFTDVVTRRKHGTGVLVALGAAAAVVGAIAVFQKFTGYGIPNPVWQAEATRRVTAFYGFPNAIGLFCAPIAVLMAGWSAALARARNPKKRPFLVLPAVAALVAVLAMFFAVSEGGLIGTAAGLLTLGLLERRTRAATLAAIIAACLVVMLWRPATDYASLIVGLRDDSGSVRSVIWKESLVMLGDHPVFGAGLSGYPARIEPYHRTAWIEIFQYPHNVILNFWTETGLIGLAAFLWIVARFYRIAATLLRRDAGGWLVGACAAAMAAILVHGLVDVPYMKNDLALLFWIIVGLVESVRQLSTSTVETIVQKIKNDPSSPWIS